MAGYYWVPATLAGVWLIAVIFAAWLVPYRESATRTMSFGITFTVILFALLFGFLAASPLGVQIFGGLWSSDDYRRTLNGTPDVQAPDASHVKWDSKKRELKVTVPAPAGHKLAYREDEAETGKYFPIGRVVKIDETVEKVIVYHVRIVDSAQSQFHEIVTKK